MKYENTTYKLAAFIGALEKIAARRTQYLTDVEKVSKDLGIYSEEYKKAHETDERGKLNTAYIMDMLKFRDSIGNLNADLMAAFAADSKPKADVSNAVHLCMQYIILRGKHADPRYFEQLATPIHEAGDIRGLKEVVNFYREASGKSKDIPFVGVIQEVIENDECRNKLELLCQKAVEALPAPDIDVASRSQAEPFSKYGQVEGLLEFTKKIKAEINKEDYTPNTVGAFNFSFTNVR